MKSKITPCLWFDGRAEEAAKFYVSVFRDAKMGEVTRYGEAGPGPKGSVMTASFTIEGQDFVGLNGGPNFKFNEAVSFQVLCETQAEVDHFWDKLSAGGHEVACGWVKDKFGLSWQIVPTALPRLLKAGGAQGERVMKAMLGMKKLDIAALERAAKVAA